MENKRGAIKGHKEMNNEIQDTMKYKMFAYIKMCVDSWQYCTNSLFYFAGCT